MAEWTPPLNYNYNQSYRHAYAYQPGPEQSEGSLDTWDNVGASDLSNNNIGVRQTHYSTAAPNQGASPLDNLEQQDPCQFLDSDVSSPSASQESPLLLIGSNTASLNTAAIVALHAASDSTGDTETYVSPDSWRSCSSREGLHQMDPATCAQNGSNHETSGKSTNSATSRKELKTNELTEEGSINKPESEIVPNEPSTTTLPKAKARVTFSESQMNILTMQFSEKQYFSPDEMRDVADMTGLSYKQVKTWFRNQRMKLRRHQEDTSFVFERHAINDGLVCGGLFNSPSYVQHYQGGAQAQLQDQFNQTMMGAPFNTPQNLPFYLATMGSASAAAGHPIWLPGPSQNAMATIPQAAGWSMPPGNGQYEYTPNAFNPSNVPANTLGYDTGFEIKNGDPSNAGSFNAARGHDVGQ